MRFCIARCTGAGQPYGTAPYGIAIPKGKGLAGPVHRAMQNLMRSGSYAAILRKWGVQVGAIDQSVINGAVDR